MARTHPWITSLLLALTGLTKGAYASEAAPADQTLYPLGSQPAFHGPEAYFTGDVAVQMLFPSKPGAPFSGAYVTFQPGARTAWHDHPAGQHMIVTEGIALTGTRDGQVHRFSTGETVWCPHDVDHWHGATPERGMTHLVITGEQAGDAVHWKEQVSDADYQAAVARTRMPEARYAALSSEQQHLVLVAAFIANGEKAALSQALAAALDSGMSINRLKEVAIHLYAYVGFPRALNALGTLMGLVEARKAAGIKDSLGAEAKRTASELTPIERGRAVQTELVGRPVAGPLFDFAPTINELLQGHLFGDLFARDLLDYRERELVTLSALATLAGAEGKLLSHVGIATNVGLDAEVLGAWAALLRERLGLPAGERADNALKSGLAAH